MTGIRKPCFTSGLNGGNRPGLSGRRNAIDLAEYTKQSHKQIASLQPALISSDPNYDEEQNVASETNTTNPECVESKKKEDETSLDQCVVLLEPHLSAFRVLCSKAGKEKAKSKKRKARDKSNQSNESSEYTTTITMQNDANLEEDDGVEYEVPPQLLRVARFFAWRWLPIKQALLRPPPPPSHNHGKPNNAANQQEVEVGMAYRLRLAKACWKRGLLAAAEYESLHASFVAAKKGIDQSTDTGGGDDDAKQLKSNALGGLTVNLAERTRLALMRLPTDAVLPERSLSAWRHVKEMIVECCNFWKETAKSKTNSGYEGSIIPLQVADWALTGWTALVLSQGMDVATHHHHTNNNSESDIEKQFAMLLSDRSESSPTLELARAVASRIDELLTPTNLESLDGMHLLSLGRLFYRFRSHDNAEAHILKSVVSCSAMCGVIGLEQLSRVLAVYSCGVATTDAHAELENASMNASHRFTPVADLERRLHARLSDKEIMGTMSTAKDRNARAQSYLRLLLGATAHLVRCSDRCDGSV
jgi:hypothetical protein